MHIKWPLGKIIEWFRRLYLLIVEKKPGFSLNLGNLTTTGIWVAHLQGSGKVLQFDFFMCKKHSANLSFTCTMHICVILHLFDHILPYHFKYVKCGQYCWSIICWRKSICPWNTLFKVFYFSHLKSTSIVHLWCLFGVESLLAILP